MLRLWASIRAFARNEDGPTAIEYAVMLSLIVAICAAAIRTIGTNTASMYSRASSSISAATSGGSSSGNGSAGSGNNGNGNGNGGGNGSNGQGGGNGNTGGS
jgi:Flp pilus assembly pilin Flp